MCIIRIWGGIMDSKMIDNVEYTLKEELENVIRKVAKYLLLLPVFQCMPMRF